MPLSSIVKSEVSKNLEKYEGRINHLYIDSEGKVTVGIGHLVANKTAIATVPMYKVQKNAAPQLATLIEKQVEYDAIAKLKKGYVAGWYKQHTTLYMNDTDMNAQREKHIAAFYKELTGLYKKSKGFKTDFDAFPHKVQMALFDMIFNLGLPKLKNQFVKFNKAIKQENWTEAAVQSHRFQLGKERNTYVKGLFNTIPKPAATTP